MSSNVDDLIREIAARHGIAVGRDDPILILQTVNERLMRESVDAQKDLLARFAQELEAVAHRWEDDAKGKAERIVNASLAATKAAMENIMQEGAAATASAMRREVDAGVVRIAASAAAGRRVAIMNIVAAVGTAVAAALVLWAVV